MSKFLDKLNSSQRKAVRHKKGPLLIIAGPGSGKTRTVVHSIAYAIENGVLPDRILAFSFTVKASEELRDQVKEIVGEEKGYLVNISTFHSFCRKVLKEDLGQLYKTEVPNFQDLDEDEQEKGDRRRVAQAINDLQYESVKLEDVHNFIIKCKLGVLPSKAGNSKYAKIYDRYEQRLKEDGWIDYSNQLIFTDELFKNVPKVKNKWQDRFELIFVDEYQDTDPVQDSIIKALAEEHQNLRVVGDDDQGIYGWRGADIQNILKFEEKFEEEYPAKVILLGQNYRSTKNIVAASSALADFNPERRDKELFTGNCEGERVKYFHCESDEEEASTIANFVHRAKEQGNRSPSDFAVLYRNNKQANAFKKAFSDLEIKVRYSSDTDTIGVSLMTIHKSKGLEFPNVFIAGVCQDLLPNYYNRHKKDWDEEIRLLYVAMTRAKNWLCLSSYDYYDKYERGQSPFLEHNYIPRHLLERVDTLENVPIPPCPKKMDGTEYSEEVPEDVESLPEKLLGDGMTVLGVDPGIRNVGWAITRKSSAGYTTKHWTQTTRGWQDTLVQTKNKIKELIISHPPYAIAIENIEIGKEETRENWFLYVAGCVATIKRIAHQHGIKCQLYTPQQVKSIATNNRGASKQEVQEGVMRICNLQQIPDSHHSADAIAASLCYLRSYLNSARYEGNKQRQEQYEAGCGSLDERQYKAAVHEFKEAINIDPIYTDAHYGLGRASIAQGDLEAAEDAVKTALRLAENNHPDSQKLLDAIECYHSGRGAAINKQFNEAITKFQESINLEPFFIDAHYELGRLHLRLSNLQEAKDVVEEALKLADDYPPIQRLSAAIKLYNAGLHFLNGRRYNDAIDKFKQAIDREPAFTEAHYSLGYAYFQSEALEASEQSAKDTLELNSNINWHVHSWLT